MIWCTFIILTEIFLTSLLLFFLGYLDFFFFFHRNSDCFQIVVLIVLMLYLCLTSVIVGLLSKFLGKLHLSSSKSYVNSQWWKTESICPKIRNKTRVSTFGTIIQRSSGSPSYSNQRRKRNKRNLDRKRRSKALTVCRWHDTVHRKP